MKRRLEPQHDDHINVTPLIDVVMCLIIFFMVCGRMAKDEVSGAVKIPKANSSAPLEDQKHRLIVNVEAELPKGVADTRESRKAATSARFLIHGQQVTEDKIIEQLRKERAEDKEMRLLIRADRDLPYPLISPLIVACARADIGSMHFATAREE